MSERIVLSDRNLRPIGVSERELSRVGISVDRLVREYNRAEAEDLETLLERRGVGLDVEGTAPERRVSLRQPAWSYLLRPLNLPDYKVIIRLPDRVAVLVRRDDPEFM